LTSLKTKNWIYPVFNKSSKIVCLSDEDLKSNIFDLIELNKKGVI